MSYISPIAGNQFFGSIGNTVVSRNTVYQASQGANKLSVLRQVSGVATIPAGLAIVAAAAATHYPILLNGEQITIPLKSIIENVEYSAVPFGGMDATLAAAVTASVQAYTSTTAATTTVPYTAGAVLSTTAATVANTNLNILIARSAATGQAAANGIWGTLGVSSTANVTTGTASKVRVTVYYYDPQDLNY